jgi:hypothetical protein
MSSIDLSKLTATELTPDDREAAATAVAKQVTAKVLTPGASASHSCPNYLLLAVHPCSL